jgi:hypothetical protein
MAMYSNCQRIEVLSGDPTSKSHVSWMVEYHLHLDVFLELNILCHVFFTRSCTHTPHVGVHTCVLQIPRPFLIADSVDELASPATLIEWLMLHAMWQDWVWSVGCNPFSITSRGWHMSQFQSDTIARSYIITALEESIQLVNAAIRRLLMEHTCILALLCSSNWISVIPTIL